jgi:hypothetical protein
MFKLGTLKITIIRYTQRQNNGQRKGDKRSNNDLQNTIKHYKTEDRVKRTPIKPVMN